MSTGNQNKPSPSPKNGAKTSTDNMEPSQKGTLPPNISQCFHEIHWLVMNIWSFSAAFSHGTFVFIRLIRRSVRKRAEIHHVIFAAIALVFDMEHTSEKIGMQLLRCPRVLIIDDIFVICLPLCESVWQPTKANNKLQFSSRIHHWDRHVCKLALFIKAAPLRPAADLIREDGEP